MKTSNTYAGISEKFAGYEKSQIVLVPVPYDGTSTWGKGADKGPEAFLEASENEKEHAKLHLRKLCGIGDTIENVKEAVHETLEASSESVKNTSEKAENIIKERPLLSVGCAFLAGWAVSKLIK